MVQYPVEFSGNLPERGLDISSIITVKPKKFITVGRFGRMDEEGSFKLID